MGSVSVTPPRPAALAERPDGRPLAWIASPGRGERRRRKDERMAAVLEEFGYRTRVADAAVDPLGAGPLDALAGAALLVCDVVRPGVDLPVELAVAATRGVAVVALVPEGVPIEGLAAQLLADCRATVVRYFRVEPHRALHERLVRAAA